MKVISLIFAKKWKEKHGDKPLPTLAELAREVRKREEGIHNHRRVQDNFGTYPLISVFSKGQIDILLRYSTLSQILQLFLGINWDIEYNLLTAIQRLPEDATRDQVFTVFEKIKRAKSSA